MELTKDINNNEIAEIIITASGGPFFNLPYNKFKKIKPMEAIKHPKWKMGKKISIDSANMMNKVFEVIEATKLFKFDKSKYKIMIHPESYVHSIIRFKNGLTKMILYKTDMKIPIFNILYDKNERSLPFVDKIDFKKINKLNFKTVDIKRFPSVKLINKIFMSGNSSSIILNATNEVLINLFLQEKIRFLDIVRTINRIFKGKDFKKYARRKVRTINDIKIVDNWARLKTMNMCVR